MKLRGNFFPRIQTRWSVMPGLVPGIHVLGRRFEGADGRDKPGHDAHL